ncbi:hypothetical protein AGDE_01304 [Angomonas deanei]|nr:hypothetical protein AGDE_01304 [Angomonas deanei]|eukprot:EPY42619.1 hypothetical protein AGDE_01304 [Angomonas deanei]
MYNEYVKNETEEQLEEWRRMQKGRRYLPHKEQYAEVISQGNPTQVIDVLNDKGDTITIAVSAFAKPIEEVKKGNKKTILIDHKECDVLLDTQRVVVPLTIKLEYGEVLETTDEDYSRYPLEVAASAKYNHGLDYGVSEYAYNRGNYIETQDVLWERHTAEREEGWSPATHADGLRPGLPVRARRALGVADPVDGPSTILGDHQRGRIVSYYHQPFFNPGDRRVTVQFAADGREEEVFLKDVLIWQRQYHGPERTVGEETRRYNPAGLRRFVDVTDPDHRKERSQPKKHFLDKYIIHNATVAEATKQKFRSTKQITEIDQWTSFDLRRPENYRPLSISHRKDYIRRGYIPRFTPWEWIITQEADQPIIKDTIRSDNIGPSSYFSLNRFWRYKAHRG